MHAKVSIITDNTFNISACTVALPSNRKDGEARLTDLHKMQWWESVSHPLMLFLAATALIVSNCLIIYKLVKSSRFRRSNMSRPSSIKKEDMRFDVDLAKSDKHCSCHFQKGIEFCIQFL